MKLRTKNRNPLHLSNNWIIILILLYLAELFMLNFVLYFFVHCFEIHPDV